MSSREKIREFIQGTLSGVRFVAVSNREPYVHTYTGDDGIQCSQPSSGMVSALDPVLQASHGTWIAHGSGNADFDVVDKNGAIRVPPHDPKYNLMRVALSPEQEEGYYHGFSNQGLWPLCHMAHRAPRFDAQHWKIYQQVNALFAEHVARSVGNSRAIVFVQDYHFALLPQMLKEKCPHAILVHFWHIPWPQSETLRICPWKQEIVRGLLGNDILGFHLPGYCENFTAGARSTFPHIQQGPGNALIWRGHRTSVRPFPAGIDFDELDGLASSENVKQKAAEFRRLYRLPQWVGVGVDRLDYIKGIPERLQAIVRFLESSPEFHGKFSFVQLAVPSRSDIDAYQDLAQNVHRLVNEINGRFAKDGWTPIVLISKNLPPADVAALYRIADFCLVTSLHDGMNLVAKEFVASRGDEKGVLLLSCFAGASTEMTDALLLNPYDTETMARLIKKALRMEPFEVSKRMRRMRSLLRRHNIFRWMIDILAVATENRVATLETEGHESFAANSPKSELDEDRLPFIY